MADTKMKWLSPTARTVVEMITLGVGIVWATAAVIQFFGGKPAAATPTTHEVLAGVATDVAVVRAELGGLRSDVATLKTDVAVIKRQIGIDGLGVPGVQQAKAVGR